MMTVVSTSDIAEMTSELSSASKDNVQNLSPEIVVMKEDTTELNKRLEHLFPEINVISDRAARSAPGSRSCSFKEKQKENELEVPRERLRRNSMPQTSENLLSVAIQHIKKEQESPLQRVRSFKTTSKGIINRGDSFRRKNEDNIACTGRVLQTDTETEVVDTDTRQRFLSDASDDTTCSTVSSSLFGYYRVAVIGESGVGKTALINQFMSSEYMGAFDINNGCLDDDEMKVSVMLNGEESMMEFIEIEDSKHDLESLMVDAYLIMYSLNDLTSYQIAVENLHRLRSDIGTDRVIVLVGNKVDLARQRLVSVEDVKHVAEEYNCKCTEISAGINHKVDELLVGILRQIRLNLNPVITEYCSKKGSKNKDLSSRGPKKLLSKLFKKNMKNVKNCDNLYEP
ncbi:hypothetical protein KUTeg_000041 [Tegillarca granosa]|uniref:Uncharacterized protein n=1 Tax=Tegillarca granosa TaxID=220873 RepID=A0ABQ9EBN3_TEGGR|nr:hypothetical protein KUTeg_018981 [Tegillarca granosa]KAJ8322409.1 hypothetical protein KUTeg_000041 [Tegillarca granosa]